MYSWLITTTLLQLRPMSGAYLRHEEPAGWACSEPVWQILG
jgi:hypothetical protein